MLLLLFSLQVWDACSNARMTFNRHSDLYGNQQESVGSEETVEDIVTSSYQSREDVTEQELMGHFVENRVILTGLSASLEECAGVEVQRGVRITEAALPHAQVREYVCCTICNLGCVMIYCT